MRSTESDRVLPIRYEGSAPPFAHNPWRRPNSTGSQAESTARTSTTFGGGPNRRTPSHREERDGRRHRHRRDEERPPHLSRRGHTAISGRDLRIAATDVRDEEQDVGGVGRRDLAGR